MIQSANNVSDTLCEFIAGSRFEQLPRSTCEAASRALLDATGVMIGASGLSQDVVPFIEMARTTGAGGNCTILGFGDRVSAPMAAFANGAMAHALDFEDAFDRAPSHPNAAAVPALLAIAQGYGPVSGKELLTAMTVGCEVACRMGLSLRQPMEQNGWYPPPILGAFGATAAAARLLRLTAQQTRDALSLVLCQATAPGEIKHSEATVIRAVREAFPAQAAVISSLLARQGVKGFETPLEGKSGFFQLFADGQYEPADLIEKLGQDFLIEELSFKPWPACRGTHAYIELVQKLSAQHAFAWRDIESIKVSTGPVHRMLLEPAERKRAPRNLIDAKFSIPFTVAVALVRGDVSLDVFNDAVLQDADVLSLAKLVEAEERNDWGREHAAAGEIRLHLKNGQTLHAAVAHALGHPGSPLSTERLVEKFIRCSGHAAHPPGDQAARQQAEAILDIASRQDAGRLLAG